MTIAIDQLHAKTAYSVLRKHKRRHELCTGGGNLQYAYVNVWNRTSFLANYVLYETAHFVTLRDKHFMYRYYVTILLCIISTININAKW